MPHSHHSHSGQFCGHALNTLEEVVQTAIARHMSVFCLTEHIPRDEEDFYPEEANYHSAASFVKLYDDFHTEALRLKEKYSSEMKILVGFEAEWIRPSSLTLIQTLTSKHRVDLFVGSVHHVHTVPIDYDHQFYYKAREVAGGTDERIFEDYFDAQCAMLQALKPPLVGHFDLIRLKSDDPERSFRQWPGVWNKILRNLGFVASYGGVLELNSSALRKGMSEPYPKVEICQEFLELGGRFALSDDSHGVDQVGLNYQRVLESVRKAGIADIHHLEAATDPESQTHDERFPTVQWRRVPVSELQDHAFWRR